jgi:hypothetical protein
MCDAEGPRHPERAAGRAEDVRGAPADMTEQPEPTRPIDMTKLLEDDPEEDDPEEDVTAPEDPQTASE